MKKTVAQPCNGVKLGFEHIFGFFIPGFSFFHVFSLTCCSRILGAPPSGKSKGIRNGKQKHFLLQFPYPVSRGPFDLLAGYNFLEKNIETSVDLVSELGREI